VGGVKALQHAQARLKLANQAYSRTKRGSNGRAKAARRLGRIHARVAALRKALLHEITEDLHAAGMVKNRGLARAVSDAAFGELRRQLTYKTGWYGTELVVADRWFPSSKTCSGCGAVKEELDLSERTYTCSTENGGCGLVIDRDLNAAVNLARYTPAENTATSPQPVAA
jgi:putative transposase